VRRKPAGRTRVRLPGAPRPPRVDGDALPSPACASRGATGSASRCEMPGGSSVEGSTASVNQTVLPFAAGVTPQSAASARTICNPRPESSAGSGARTTGSPGPLSPTATRIWSGDRSTATVKWEPVWRTALAASSETITAMTSAVPGEMSCTASSTKRRASLTEAASFANLRCGLTRPAAPHEATSRLR
jgi:hypothetical protein